MKSYFKIKIILAFLFSVWILFIFSEPFFFSSKIGFITYPFVKKGLNLICHQEEAKLISFFGYNSFLCTRCVGLYLGVLAGLLFSFFIHLSIKTNQKLFAAATTLIILDIVIYDYIQLYSYNKIIAFATGLFLGSTLFNYFWDSLTKLKESDK
ncbi:MAG: DUF2085 domain-containing protein [Melioribacteraceae bacterium]|nr:DUF2085 domain-containing protein [Melioribacteraceae bacterium]